MRTQKVCCGLQANFPDRGKCFCSVWGLQVSREIGHAVSARHGDGGGRGSGGGAGLQVRGIKLAAAQDHTQLIYILQRRLAERRRIQYIKGIGYLLATCEPLNRSTSQLLRHVTRQQLNIYGSKSMFLWHIYIIAILNTVHSSFI
jgi:hypothetical protein